MRELLDNSIEDNSNFVRKGSRMNTVHESNVIQLIPTLKPPSKFKNSDASLTLNSSNVNEEIPVHRKNKKNLKNINKNNIVSRFKNDNKKTEKTQNQKTQNEKTQNEKNKEKNEIFTEATKQPMFKQGERNLNNEENSKSSSGLSADLLDQKKQDKKDLILNFDNENSDDEDEKEKELSYEGYLIKVVEKKMRRIWFKLLGRDLFYFKNEKDELHKGMHHLSGIFIQEEKPKVFNGKKYLCFSMIYPKKTRMYYCEKENEYKIWIEKLKIATGFTNLTDIYDIGEKIGNGKFGLIKKGINKKTGKQVAIKIMSKKDIYEVKQKLGNGKFGLVKLGINKQTNQKVAIKIMSKKQMNTSDLELVRTEIEILKICQHPNIIKLYDIFENENYYYIIMEYCSGGDLFSFLERHQFKLKEELASKIMHKICAAIYYIHSYGICHRDLKPENILMTSKNENSDIRLLDFGLSKIIGPNETCNEPYGTLTYCAPEILLDNPYTKQVDLWSLGVMTYLMLTGKLPFHDRIDREIAKKAAFTEPDYSDKLWNGISDDAINFVKGLLKKKGDERMNIKEALQHNWIKKFCDDDIFESRNKCKENASKEFQVYSSVKEGEI